MRTSRLSGLFIALATIAAGPPVHAAEPCDGFKWDVARERALFNGQSRVLAAGKDAVSAPPIGVERLYELRLLPQPAVTFAVPGKKTPNGQGFGGVALLELPAPGLYRISLDAAAWVDLAATGMLAPTRDFQGQKGCDAPHKIVEFDLSSAARYLLQVSSEAASVRLTVTRAAAPGT